MSRVLFVFLDGVGVGGDDPAVNPFAATPTPTLDGLVGRSVAGWDGTTRCDDDLASRTLDATLGRAGLPQSATGQSALLSGRDATQAMAGHYGPWPGPTLKRFLAEGNLFQWAAARGAQHANAYPPDFFRALAAGRLRLNAPAHAAREAGVPLADLDAYRAGRAVAPDLDGAAFASRGVVPPGAPAAGPEAAEAAGGRLARLAGASLLTFFDVWTTDRLGHRADAAAAAALIARLDAFLAGVLSARPRDVTVVVTSDHGNLEDLRHGRHTRADVPLWVVGRGAPHFAEVRTLCGVAPAIRAAWASDA